MFCSLSHTHTHYRLQDSVSRHIYIRLKPEHWHGIVFHAGEIQPTVRHCAQEDKFCSLPRLCSFPYKIPKETKEDNVTIYLPSPWWKHMEKFTSIEERLWSQLKPSFRTVQISSYSKTSATGKPHGGTSTCFIPKIQTQIFLSWLLLWKIKSYERTETAALVYSAYQYII